MSSAELGTIGETQEEGRDEILSEPASAASCGASQEEARQGDSPCTISTGISRAKSRRNSTSGFVSGNHHHHHHHENELHDRSIQTVTLNSSLPLDLEKFKSFVDYLLWEQEAHPELELFRMKGLLDLQGSDKKNMLQAVYQLYSLNETEEWAYGEGRR